jgi:hypothetical protein
MKTFIGKRVFSKFFAYSSSMMLVLLVSLAPLSAPAEPYQCDVSGDDKLGLEEAVYLLQHFSGAFTAGSHEVLDCGEPDFEITESGDLSVDAKRYILCRINEIRSQVALGTISDDGTNGTWPVATNMKRMQWDENLATVAQNYADECNYGHNSSRGTDYAALSGLDGPAVGENIAAQWTSGSLGSTNALMSLESAFFGWNGENDLWHYDTINNSSWGTGFGHFTQHARPQLLTSAVVRPGVLVTPGAVIQGVVPFLPIGTWSLPSVIFIRLGITGVNTHMKAAVMCVLMKIFRQEIPARMA